MFQRADSAGFQGAMEGVIPEVSSGYPFDEDSREGGVGGGNGGQREKGASGG